MIEVEVRGGSIGVLSQLCQGLSDLQRSSGLMEGLLEDFGAAVESRHLVMLLGKVLYFWAILVVNCSSFLVLALCFGLLQAFGSHFSPALVGSVITSLAMLFVPLQSMLRQLLELDGVFHSVLSLVSVAQHPHPPLTPKTKEEADEGDDDDDDDDDGPLLSIRQASVSLSGEPIFSDVCLEVQQGESVGICGRTGVGKSVLASAIVGLNALSSGTVCFQGQDIAHMPESQLLRDCLLLPQRAVLLSGPLRHNLSPPGGPSDSDEGLLRVVLALSPSLHSKLASDPLGLDRPVASATSEFSLGERQVLALVRAVVRRPRLMILDEATSGMDSSSEHRVLQQLRLLLPTCAFISITHRYVKSKTSPLSFSIFAQPLPFVSQHSFPLFDRLFQLSSSGLAPTW